MTFVFNRNSATMPSILTLDVMANRCRTSHHSPLHNFNAKEVGSQSKPFETTLMGYDETSQLDLKASHRELQVTIVSGHGRPIPHAAIAVNEVKPIAAEFKNVEIG